MEELDYQQAAFELDAVAEQIFPYIARLDRVIEYLRSHNGWFPENPPPELQVYITDLYDVHQSGERTFLRHLPIYPSLRDEWISGTLQQFKMTLTEGHRAVMLEKYTLLKKCAAIARGKAGLAAPTQGEITHHYYGEVHMGDNYSANQAGAMGPGSHAHDMTFNQVWNESGAKIDTKQLASELAQLRSALTKEASEPDHFIALGEVAAAEKAATANDGPTALQHLKKAGVWVWDVGTKVGIGVAIAAAKTALGL